MAANNPLKRTSSNRPTRAHPGQQSRGDAVRLGARPGQRTALPQGGSRRRAATGKTPRAGRSAISRPSGGDRRTGSGGGGGAGAGAAVLSTLQQNAVPALIIGAGLTWMLLGRRIASVGDAEFVRRGRRAIGELGETFTESFDDAAHGTSAAVRRAAGSVKNGLMTIGEYAHGGVESVGGAIRDGAGAIGRGARRGVGATRQTMSVAWDDHPLIVCAAVLAAGVTAGMLLPPTRGENRAMGRASSAVARQVRSKGQDLLKQGKALAGEAVQTAGREARRQGLTARDIGQRVKRVAAKARETIATA